MFGGSNGSGTPYDDTWEFNGTSWTEIVADTCPSRRGGHTLAYDTQRHRIVLFGGMTEDGLSNETWEYDGLNWVEVAAGTPPPRAFHAMVYDARRGRTIVFGGKTNSGIEKDTWEYDGHRWLQNKTRNAPTTRHSHAMTYDSDANFVFLFGGFDPEGQMRFADSWKYDGLNWLLLSDTLPPTGRSLHALTYDMANQQVVLFGGTTGTGILLSETYVADILITTP